MGAIWIDGNTFCGELSDLAGFKMGVAAGLDIIRAGSERVGVEPEWLENLDAVHRIRSEVVEEVARGVLLHLGDPDAADRRPLAIALRDEFEDLTDLDAVMTAIVQHLPLVTSSPGPKGYDPAPFLSKLKADVGVSGVRVGLRALELLNARLMVSPWAKVRRREWEDVIDLNDLFVSEDVKATYGEFFDQRFIDFLAENFAEIDRINWRKFEALTAEWFSRLGYSVELGPGRNDDGVDIRAWADDRSTDGPPLLIAQCKRQASTISKVVLKAVYADVEHSKASKGVIVTTSRFAPGTDRVNRERGYGIEEANRQVVEKWIAELRTPGTGVFLGE